jgi:hypothetical protein
MKFLLMAGLLLLASGCSSSSNNGTTGGGLKSGFYSCDATGFSGGHVCTEATIVVNANETAEQSIGDLKPTCEGNNTGTPMGLGFSTTRACDQSKPGCVCETHYEVTYNGTTTKTDSYTYQYAADNADFSRQKADCKSASGDLTGVTSTSESVFMCFGGQAEPAPDAGP